MENQPDSFGALFENASNYVETKVNLLKLQAVDKSSDLVSSIVSSLAVIIIIFFAFIILNIGLAIWIGEMLGEMYWGFFITGGFYGLLALLLYIFRRSWLKEPMSSSLIKKMLN